MFAFYSICIRNDSKEEFYLYDIKQSDQMRSDAMRCDTSQKQHNDFYIVIIYITRICCTVAEYYTYRATYTCHLYLRSYQLFIKYSYGSRVLFYSFFAHFWYNFIQHREKSKRIHSSFFAIVFLPVACQRLNYNYFKNCHKWVMVTTPFVSLTVV